MALEHKLKKAQERFNHYSRLSLNTESPGLADFSAQKVAEIAAEIAGLNVKIEKRDKAKAKKEQKESLKEPTVYFYCSRSGIEKRYPVSEIACFSQKNP